MWRASHFHRSVDRATRLSPCEVSRELRQMHQRLFPRVSADTVIDDINTRRILRKLRAAVELSAFRLWLVGSRLQAKRASADLDLVLSPQPKALINDSLVDSALVYCRTFGLYEAEPSCLIDAAFRWHGCCVALKPLEPDSVIHTVKLLSPRILKLVADGGIESYRRVGHFSIAFGRRARDLDYFTKLPKGFFDGRPSRYLRPAIEVT
jgi:hypothetical protein